MLLRANLARQADFTTLFVPAEVSLIEGLTIYPVQTLLQLVDHLTGHNKLTPHQPNFSLEVDECHSIATNLAEIKGQEYVKFPNSLI